MWKKNVCHYCAAALLTVSACAFAGGADPRAGGERHNAESGFFRATGQSCALRRYRRESRDADGSLWVKSLNKTEYAPSTLYLITCGTSVYTVDVPDNSEYRPYLMRCLNGERAYHAGCIWFRG